MAAQVGGGNFSKGVCFGRDRQERLRSPLGSLPSYGCAWIVGVFFCNHFQLLTVRFVKLRGQYDLNFREQVSWRALLWDYAMPFHPQLGATGGAGGNGKGNRTLGGGHDRSLLRGVLRRA